MFVEQSQQLKSIDPLIIGIMDENNSTRLGAMNILLKKAWNHRLVFVSQTYLAKELDVERETANRTIKWLREHGWIRTKRRYNDTLLYFVNPEIITHRERLKWKLPALRYVLCVSMLWQQAGKANVTSNILMNNLYRNQSIPLIINQSNQSIFLKNQSAPSSDGGYLTKEKVMSAERSIINQIKDKFGIPDDQMSFFEKHSDIVLQEAIVKYDEARKGKPINHPIGYFRRVVGTAQENHERKAETGRTKGHSSKSSNPHGHSPSLLVEKTSKDERISFVLREIANYEQQLSERRKWLKNVPGGEYLITMAENAIANYKRELSELHYSPDDIQCEAPRYKEEDPAAAEHRFGDREYDQHLDDISKDKSDPSGYKELVRKYDYNRTLLR